MVISHCTCGAIVICLWLAPASSTCRSAAGLLAVDGRAGCVAFLLLYLMLRTLLRSYVDGLRVNPADIAALQTNYSALQTNYSDQAVNIAALQTNYSALLSNYQTVLQELQSMQAVMISGGAMFVPPGNEKVVGIGLGVGLGVPVVVAIAVVGWWRSSRASTTKYAAQVDAQSNEAPNAI